MYAIYGLESVIFFEEQAINETKLLEKSLVPRIGIKEEIIRPMPPTSLLKNSGLAHVYLMKNLILAHSEGGTQARFLPEIVPDVYGTLEKIDWPSSNRYADRSASDTYVKWSSLRFLKYWGEFLKRKDAKEDAQYATIKQMYDQLYPILTR